MDFSENSFLDPSPQRQLFEMKTKKRCITRGKTNWGG
jgi:hypothetical protein